MQKKKHRIPPKAEVLFLLFLALSPFHPSLGHYHDYYDLQRRTRQRRRKRTDYFSGLETVTMRKCCKGESCTMVGNCNNGNAPPFTTTTNVAAVADTPPSAAKNSSQIYSENILFLPSEEVVASHRPQRQCRERFRTCTLKRKCCNNNGGDLRCVSGRCIATRATANDDRANIIASLVTNRNINTTMTTNKEEEAMLVIPENRTMSTKTNETAAMITIANSTIPLGRIHENENEEARRLTFYAMADTPYNPRHRQCLLGQLQNELDPKVSTLVFHLGDIKRGINSISPCDESVYRDISHIFQRGRFMHQDMDTLFVPGDNEWNDCTDKSEAWSLWKKHFGINTDFHGLKSSFSPHFHSAVVVDRLSLSGRDGDDDNVGVGVGAHVENFAFLIQTEPRVGGGEGGGGEAVAFFGLNLVAGNTPDEGIRLEMNYNWIRDKFQEYHERGMKAAIILGHADLRGKRSAFGDKFKQLLQNKDRMYSNLPVLYLHGNGHKFEIDYRYEELNDGNNLTSVQLDAGYDAPPLILSVRKGTAPSGSYWFQYDRRGGKYHDDRCPY